MYYPCGENKGADQLSSYCEADLCLCFCYIDSTIPLLCFCFRICKSLVFSLDGSYFILSDTKLTPIINNTSPTITTTSIQISWSVEPEVSGLTLFYNVTCSSVRSGKFRSFTARTVRNVTCDQLNEGDQYDIEVVTYFTQTNGDVASQTATTTFSTSMSLRKLAHSITGA